MIVAVLDTNVLVAGFPAKRGVPARLINAWRQGAFQLVVSEPLLAELAETWRDPCWRFRITPAESTRVLALLRAAAIVTQLMVNVTGVAAHPEDDRILATAIAGQADYLVTGDRRLRAIGSYQGVLLLSPREFLEQLESDVVL